MRLVISTCPRVVTGWVWIAFCNEVQFTIIRIKAEGSVLLWSDFYRGVQERLGLLDLFHYQHFIDLWHFQIACFCLAQYIVQSTGRLDSGSSSIRYFAALFQPKCPFGIILNPVIILVNLSQGELDLRSMLTCSLQSQAFTSAPSFPPSWDGLFV